MPVRSHAFLVFMVGCCWQPGCGARTGTEGGPPLGALGAGDAGLPDVVGVDVDPGNRVRPNRPSEGVPDGPPGLTPDLPGPRPSIAPNPPTAAPDNPGMPAPDPAVPMVPGTEPSPEPDAPPGPEPDAPLVPEPDGTDPEPPAPDAPNDPDAPRLWLYVDDGEGLLVNVRDDRERFLVPSVVLDSPLLKPWSGDGSRLTVFHETTLSFHDLVTGQELSSNDTGTAMDLFGWVEGFGALVGYYYEARPVLYLGEPSGGFRVLGETPELSLATEASSSPSGNALLYVTEYDDRAQIYWVGLDTEDGEPVELLDAASATLERSSWSPNGAFAAFVDGAGSAWLVDGTRPAELQPLGATDAPVVFSPSGAHAAVWRGQSVALWTLVPGNAPTLTDLDGASSSPRFSTDGAFLYHATRNGAGALLALDDPDTVHGLDGFDVDCPLVWTAEGRFLYQRCAEAGQGLAEGVVEGDTLRLVTYDEPLREHLNVGAEQRCFVNWDDRELDVGTTSLPFDAEFTRSAPAEITHAALSPRDSAVVWVENGTEVYWLPLNGDCTVSTLPRLVHDSGAVQSVAFVGEWP